MDELGVLPKGAEAFSAAGRVPVPGRLVAVADTVGAGDTFQAALIAALAERDLRTRAALDDLDTATLSRVLDFAVGAAALTCTRRGADLPRRSDIPALDPERRLGHDAGRPTPM